MTQDCWLILLKALYRAGMLFLKDGVAKVISKLEAQDQSPQRGNGRGRKSVSMQRDQ